MPNLPATGLAASSNAKPPAPSANPPALDETSLLNPLDVPKLRTRIYDHVFNSVKNTPPVENTRYRLKIENPRWNDPEDWGPAHQKKVFFQGGTLARRLQGDYVLEDVPSGKEVSRKTATIMAVPHLNNRGLFLINGSHWTLSSQTRLDPGMYPRRQENGEIEAYINPKGGRQHRVALDPESGIFHMEMGQSRIPLMPILRSLGVEHKQLHDAWGHELVAKNSEKDDPAVVKKLLAKLYDSGKLPQGVPERKLLEEKFHAMQLDPYVTSQTVGTAHDRYDANAILNVTKHLLAINRGEKQESVRDHQAFQKILGQEHLFGERAKNTRPLLNQMLWKATHKGNLDHVPSGYFNQHMLETITGTGLGINAQMTNPAEMLDSLYRVTKMGSGGIKSLESVPDACYDQETQVFTKTGWVKWEDVTAETELACRIDGALAFHKPVWLYRKEYSGLMYGIKTLTLDHLVTPGHRMWCRKVRGTGGKKRCGVAPWQFELAKDGYRKPREFMIASGPYDSGSTKSRIVIPEVRNRLKNRKGKTQFAINDWAEFVGWYAAEGGMEKSPGSAAVSISQSAKANSVKVGRIAELLTRLGLKWGYSGHNFVFSDMCVKSWLIANVGRGSRNKRLPPGFIDWPVSARQRMFESLVAGDGSKHVNGAVTFLSTSRQLRDDFMLLAISLGHAVRERKTYEHDNPKHNPAYYCGVLVRQVQGVTSERMYDKAYYTKEYQGMIYCAEVPGGLLLVRRGRSVGMWSGNSRNVQSSQFHFVDPVVTPESSKAGVDLRFASGTRRDNEGKLYARYTDPTGKSQWMTARDLQGKTIGSWEERNSSDGMVSAIQDGEMKMIPRNKVDFWSPPMEHAFSPAANLIPFKSASPPHRAAMGARMTTQALPLVGGESPHVQSGHPEGGSYEQRYGEHFGAIRAKQGGKVMSVTPDAIKVKYQDGTTEEVTLHKHELYDHAPGRKTHFTQSPVVKAGDFIQPGQLVARSNYTDDKGQVALGLNARTAWLPGRRGGTFEDAFAVSESFAQRMRSDHMALHSLEDRDATFGRSSFRSLFPAKYDPAHLKEMDDNGVIKPGAIVKPGQPLILGARQVTAPRTTLVRSPKPVWQDISEVWDHDYPGEVIDAVKTRDGYRVSVKSAVPMQDADKMCYSDDTEVLTSEGWKNVTTVSLSDRVASLKENGSIEYLQPVELHKYEHDGDMYSLETTQVSLLVTLNHKLYVKSRYASSFKKGTYSLREASEMLGRNFKMKRDGVWTGKSPAYFEFPAVEVDAGQFGRGKRTVPAKRMPVRDYMMLLGMFLSEGNVFCESHGNYGIDIHQVKPKNRKAAAEALTAAGIQFTECPSKFRLYSLQLYLHFQQFGKCWEKFIPGEVFDYAKDDLKVLYDWMMWGDGHVTKGNCHIYTTTSNLLADDFQRLALHVGWSANIDTKPATTGFIKGKEYDFRPCHKVYVYKHKNEPEINYAYGKRESTQTEQTIGYSGHVYCVTLPRNHVLYVRRKGKPVWCGNSGRHGNKGIVTIVPDHEMPRGEDGKPFEVLISPYTLSSRGNDSQIAETLLAKVAAKTGKKYAIPDFNLQNLMQFANDEAKKNNVSPTETVHDPVTGVKIPGVLTGNQYFMKLHHLVEQKIKQRDTGGYDSFDTPARGGSEGAKRMALSDTFALLAHNATSFLRGSKLVRGQRNEHFWEAVMSGYTPPTPGIPMQYRRFVEGLKASGIHPVTENGKMRLMALTDNAIDRLAGDRELKNAKGVDWAKGGDPIEGGLFDRKLHGEDGSRWSKLSLYEPMPNPAFEDPIRYTLGLTEKQMRNVVAGKGGFIAGKYAEPKLGEEMPRTYQTGPSALHEALKNIDIDKEIAKNEEDIRGTKKTRRDAAIRRQKYLQGAKDQGIHPSQWMMTKMPVLPPMFRPVSKMQGSNTEIASDPNYLYQDLFNANKNLQSLHGRVHDLSAERLAVYDAVKAVSGLGDPINPKTQQKGVKGMLKLLLADSPKWSIVQRNLLSSPVDLVGRSTVGPDANLDMDELGIPEAMAHKVYSRFTIKRLVQGGMSPSEAVRAVNEQTPEARKALLAEMAQRPVSYHRAPVLHKYGHIGAWPKLVKGDVIKVSPFVIKGLGMDFDGDTANIHVPVYPEEVKDVVEKMMPSKNLLSAKDFNIHYKPDREFHVGLWQATSPDQKPKEGRRERVFEDIQALKRAFANGEISVHDKVSVMKH